MSTLQHGHAHASRDNNDATTCLKVPRRTFSTPSRQRSPSGTSRPALRVPSASSASTMSQAAAPASSMAASPISPADLSASFATFGVLLERESDEVESVSKLVRDLHRINRAVASSLQSIHTTGCTSDAALSAVAAAAQAELMASTPVYQSMSSIIRASSSPAYKLHHVWQFALQQSIFLLALTHYLQHRSLLPLSAVSSLLQLDLVQCDLDDYLTGVTYISKELTRLAVNAVRSGNASLVSPISLFLHDLYAAYRLLNLRNGDLRRKVDGLKYDVLKVEEVLYDMAVRKGKGGDTGDVQPQTQPTPPASDGVTAVPVASGMKD